MQLGGVYFIINPMKKILSPLFFLFLLTSCSITVVNVSSFFISELINGNYYLVEYSSEKTGITTTVTNVNPIDANDIKIFTVEEFKTVARLDSSTRLPLVSSNGVYTGSFVHNNTLYTFNHMYNSTGAVYSYTFFSRSDTNSFKAYAGFIIQNNGLYIAQRKDTNIGTTTESTIAFYAEDNIDFSAVDGAPIYQKLGTTPVF